MSRENGQLPYLEILALYGTSAAPTDKVDLHAVSFQVSDRQPSPSLQIVECIFLLKKL